MDGECCKDGNGGMTETRHAICGVRDELRVCRRIQAGRPTGCSESVGVVRLNQTLLRNERESEREASLSLSLIKSAVFTLLDILLVYSIIKNK